MVACRRCRSPGTAAPGERRPALVSSLPRRTHPPRRLPALDQAEPELEFHVRRVPLDRRAQELRCGKRSLRHQLGRDQRRLRGLPREGLGACRLGKGPAKSVAVRKARRSGEGLGRRFDERHDVTWPIDPKTGNARRSVMPATLRKEVETCGLCHARRAGFSEGWVPGRWLSHTHLVSPLIRGLYHADGQMRDEVLRMARSSRARCSRPASPAAIATSRTAPSRGSPVTTSACNVTPHRSIRAQHTTTTRRSLRRSPAPRAICRRGPTW